MCSGVCLCKGVQQKVCVNLKREALGVCVL